MAALVAEKAILSEHNLNFVTIQGAEMLKTTCKLVTDFLSEREVPFVPAECGLFVFARFSNSGDTDVEKEFQLCLRSHHVALLSGTGCHFGQPGWFRVCYSVPPEKLSEGLKRLDKALADHRKLHIK
jgi:aspartate/methionine/tyrosine aminotransferase